MKTSLRILILLSLALLPIYLLQPLPNRTPFQPQGLGALDFIEYFSAFQLFVAGKNPFNPVALFELQKALGYKAEHPMMMWNGPWLLPLMAPVLIWDFRTASLIWFILNVLFAIGTGYFTWSALGKKQSTLAPCLVASIFFFPAWMTLAFGQVSLLISFGVSLLFYALVKRGDVLRGSSLIFLTIKPHLTYLVLIVLGWWIVRRKRFLLLGVAIASFAILLAVTSMVSPQAVVDWVEAMRNQPQGSVPREEWLVGTLVGFIRYLYFQRFHMMPLWPGAVIPGVTAIVVLSYFVLRVRGRELSWTKTFPWVLALSVFSSPYGWLFDFSLLLLVQVMIVDTVVSRGGTDIKALLTLGSLIVLQLGCYIAADSGFSFHHHFWWYPLPLLMVWVFAAKLQPIKVLK